MYSVADKKRMIRGPVMASNTIALMYACRDIFMNGRMYTSFLVMRSDFFVPRPTIEETAVPNWLKICMGLSRGMTRVIVDFWIRAMETDSLTN